MNAITEIAYAKINLALHIRRRRKDGYHELDTLFVFVDEGDLLEISPADEFQLSFSGEFGELIGGESVESNLITRTARAICGGVLPAIRVKLAKKLPIAAGLGGGSADAAAIIRALARYLDFDVNGPEILAAAARLGADIPACIQSVPVFGKGTGTELSSVINDVTGLYCLLVNPRIALSTASVFSAWGNTDLGALPSGTARNVGEYGRNDLEDAATTLCPQIAEILAYLRETKPIVARMSGSGATCFALYDDHEITQQLSRQLQISHPHWWHMAGRLR